MISPEQIRQDFQFYFRKSMTNPWVYLDNATTRKTKTSVSDHDSLLLRQQCQRPSWRAYR